MRRVRSRKYPFVPTLEEEDQSGPVGPRLNHSSGDAVHFDDGTCALRESPSKEP